MNLIVQPALLILLVTFFSTTEAMTRLSYNYWSLDLISPEDRAPCLVNVTNNAVDPGTCYNIVSCMLESATEYAKLGLASGTSLLSLVPAALSLIPTNAPGVEEAVGIGWLFALLAAFSGYITSGKASSELADVLKPRLSEKTATERDLLREKKIEKGWRDEKSEVKFIVCGPLRWFLYSLVVGISSVLIYLIVILGLWTLVTWACNHDMLHLGWLFARMFPYMIELALLKCLRPCLRKFPAAMKPFKDSETSIAWFLAQAISGFSLLMTGLVIVYGMGLMGSTNLIDGSTVIGEYLLLFPVLFCSMQTILRICALRSQREK